MHTDPSSTSHETTPRWVIRDDAIRQGRILLVDSDVASLCLLENVLTRLGFTNLKLVMRPDKAFAHFTIVQPDLIITEIAMRDFDAFQLIERIRALPTQDASVPILVLSADADVKNKRRALVVGATDLLLKPFDSSELLMRIRNLLQARFLYREICEQNEDLEKRVEDRTQKLQKTVTELKEAQNRIVQQERFRAFGEMAGGVVHDFNNALMSIIGYSKLLLDEPQALSTIETAREICRSFSQRVRIPPRSSRAYETFIDPARIPTSSPVSISRRSSRKLSPSLNQSGAIKHGLTTKSSVSNPTWKRSPRFSVMPPNCVSCSSIWSSTLSTQCRRAVSSPFARARCLAPFLSTSRTAEPA